MRCAFGLPYEGAPRPGEEEAGGCKHELGVVLVASCACVYINAWCDKTYIYGPTHVPDLRPCTSGGQEGEDR